MAEELIPGVCGSGAAAAGSWWCNSMPSISAPVSCSAQHTNMNGSFNWAAAITHLFDVEPDIHFSQDSAQFLDSTPEEILEFGHPLFMDALVRGDGSSGILQIQEASPTESRQVIHPEILESSFLFGPLTGSTGFTSPAAALQGLAELDSQLLQQPVDHTYDQSCMNDHEDSNELSRSPIEPEPLQLLQYSSPPELQHQLLSSTNPEAPWPPNLVQRGFGESFSSSKRGTKSNSRTGGSTNCSQPAAKRPRIETPSPLPTFKVRKEKLGDRITALQQLVSPFGKTDTASVLHEAIDYIKFLHDQVRVLSSPGQKNGQQIPQTKEDLGSRGLCLVPVSATFGIAREPPVDIWSAFFGGMSG